MESHFQSQEAGHTLRHHTFFKHNLGTDSFLHLPMGADGPHKLACGKVGDRGCSTVPTPLKAY